MNLAARGLTAVILSLVALAGAAGPILAADPVVDPERNTGTPTAWRWLRKASPSTINAEVEKGFRIIDLQPDGSGPTFTATLVRNAGPTYGRTWWWYYGLGAQAVADRLDEHNGRLIDIEAYGSGASLRFAVVMVRNTGAAEKAWEWWYGLTPGEIATKAEELGGRVTNVSRYSTGAGDRFAAILVRLDGPDDRPWAHLYGVSGDALAEYLDENALRLIDLHRTPSGTWDAVMVGARSRSPEPGWWWRYGMTSTAQVNDWAARRGARAIQVVPYTTLGGTRLAALYLDNLPAESRRLHNLVGTDLDPANWGFYVKRVGGPVLAALRESTVFEPASTMKAVHHLWLLRDTRQRDLDETREITWYANPSSPARYPESPGYGSATGPNDIIDKNHCAYADDGDALVTTVYADPITTILEQMMRQSDNRTTDAIVIQAGFRRLNTLIDSLGMSSSHLNHRIGCPSASSPQPWKHNQLTLADIGRLYERVRAGTSGLGTGEWRSRFFELMSSASANSALATIAAEEASDAGLSGPQSAAFVGGIRSWSKGGSYDMCPDSGPCNEPVMIVRTGAGVLRIPAYEGVDFGYRYYVYGSFLDREIVSCTFAEVQAGSCTEWENDRNAFGRISPEMFRAALRDAASTWP